MTSKPVVDTSKPFVDDGFAERWAAWEAHGAANDRVTRRRLFAVVVIAAAILTAWVSF
jgi:hypothetical protein